MKKLLVGLIGLLVLATAWGQTTSLTAKIVFTPPTTRTDGSAITGPLFYVVLAGPKGQTQKSRLLTTTVANATSISVPNVSPGTCFQLITSENQIEGPPSNESCILSAPNAATNLTVTVTITIAPTPAPSP